VDILLSIIDRLQAMNWDHWMLPHLMGPLPTR
jgi:hypothetical protein